MTLKILFSASKKNWSEYKAPLEEAFASVSLDYDLRTSFAPSEVDYIIYAPSSSLQDFSPYTSLKAVLNLWAGVEGVAFNKTLKVPLARIGRLRFNQWNGGMGYRSHLTSPPWDR